MTSIKDTFLNLEDIESLINRDKMIRLLREADADFIAMHDVHQGKTEIYIKTDVAGKFLQLVYGDKDGFRELNVSMSSFDILLGACINATFAAHQFDSISHFTGSNVFPVSAFEHR